MQFARPAIIEQAVGDVAILLDFYQTEPRPDRMDRACGQVKEIACLCRMPDQQVLDRSVQRGSADGISGHVLLETDGQTGTRLGIDDQPAFILAATALWRLGGWGMDLD